MAGHVLAVLDKHPSVQMRDLLPRPYFTRAIRGTPPGGTSAVRQGQGRDLLPAAVRPGLGRGQDMTHPGDRRG
jgi:hypothetical protein